MNAPDEIEMADVEVSDSWGQSVTDNLERSRRAAWIIAASASFLALLLAIAIVILLPLKRVEPYTLLVDRQTGYVEELAPIEKQTIAPDAALTRSFLVQYAIARESFDADSVDNDYRKVSLWSASQARQRYINMMQSTNPASPLSYMPRGGVINVEVLSVSSLKEDQSLVRFTTVRTDPGAQPQAPQYWASVVNFTYSGAAMTEADRLVNPLGFQVTRYRRNAETIPEAQPTPPSTTVASPTPISTPAPNRSERITVEAEE